MAWLRKVAEQGHADRAGRPIPVRENVLGQLYGASRFLAWERNRVRRSPTAHRFAAALQVVVKECEPLKNWPRRRVARAALAGGERRPKLG